MAGARHWEQDKEATVYIGNLDERVSDGLIWELMLQAGRIVNVHLPKDRVTQSHQGYGFVEFNSEEDAEYASRIMNQVRLYGKPIRVNKASADKQKQVEVGAELFVGNLDPMVTEQILYDTFGRFGSLLAPPKVSRDEAGISKGYGFVSFSNFEASDDAIAGMNGQYLMNKEVSVQYAYKKDGKGERHGDQAERLLAAQASKHGVQVTGQAMPPAFFSGVAGNAPMSMANGDHGMQTAGSTSHPDLPNGSGMPPQRPPPNGAPPYAPPSGLPARPPPSNAGYGPPQGFAPPPQAPFGVPQGGPPPGGPPPRPGYGPPPGFGGPAGFGPPGSGPPGAPPPGFPSQSGVSG